VKGKAKVTQGECRERKTAEVTKKGEAWGPNVFKGVAVVLPVRLRGLGSHGGADDGRGHRKWQKKNSRPEAVEKCITKRQQSERGGVQKGFTKGGYSEENFAV